MADLGQSMTNADCQTIHERSLAGRRCRATAKAAGASLVRAPARRLCAAFEKVEADLPRRRTAGRTPARPLRAHALEPHRSHRRRRWRRRHEPDQGPRVREGRHPHLDGPRRVRARVPQPDPRRRRGSPLLGLRRVADRASRQSARAHRAHEHAHGRDVQMVVRRRRRPHADAGQAAHAGRRRHAWRSTRRCRPRAPRTKSRTTRASSNGATSTSICRIGARSAASAASSTTG